MAPIMHAPAHHSILHQCQLTIQSACLQACVTFAHSRRLTPGPSTWSPATGHGHNFCLDQNKRCRFIMFTVSRVSTWVLTWLPLQESLGRAYANASRESCVQLCLRMTLNLVAARGLMTSGIMTAFTGQKAMHETECKEQMHAAGL